MLSRLTSTKFSLKAYCEWPFVLRSLFWVLGNEDMYNSPQKHESALLHTYVLNDF